MACNPLEINDDCIQSKVTSSKEEAGVAWTWFQESIELAGVKHRFPVCKTTFCSQKLVTEETDSHEVFSHDCWLLTLNDVTFRPKSRDK